MADTKISDLSALTAADPDNDMLVIVDDSDTTMAASGTDKRIVVTDLVKTVGSGDNYAIVTALDPDGERIYIRQGTSGSPVTTGPGNALRVAKTDAVTQTTRDGWTGVSAGGQTGDDTAAIVGAMKGTTASELQVTGVCGVASNAGTGGSQADACGVFGHGWQRDAGAVGRAIGGYFAGRSELTAPKISGVEVQCQNRGGTNDTFDSSGTSNTVGLLISSVGARETRGCGIQFSHGTSAPKYDVGIGFSSNDGGACVTATLVDGTSSVTSLDINGSHTTGLDLAGATFSGAAIALGAGHNISIATTTGTKIGTGTTQLIGFWNATPVAKPTNTITLTNYTAGSRSFNRSSYTMDGLADVVCELVKQLGDTAGPGLVNDA